MIDPYLQDDGRTLRNKLGVHHDPGLLQETEAAHTFLRRAELRGDEFPKAHGFELLKAIHGHLFQDVYDWAGQSRTVPLAKAAYEDGTERTVFTDPALIERDAARIFERLAAENDLRGLSKVAFTDRLADNFIQLNALHPFREGNGRTQRLLWEHIAAQAGHLLHFEGISRERMVCVSIGGVTGDQALVGRMFEELLDPDRAHALVKAARFLENSYRQRSGMDWNDRYVATTVPGRDYKGIFAGAGGADFLLGSGERIYVGKLADLPDRGAGLATGARVEFRT